MFIKVGKFKLLLIDYEFIVWSMYLNLKIYVVCHFPVILNVILCMLINHGITIICFFTEMSYEGKSGKRKLTQSKTKNKASPSPAVPPMSEPEPGTTVTGTNVNLEAYVWQENVEG